LTPEQWEVTVKPDGHRGLDYQAGQFAWLNVGHGAFSMKENPFSICSAPAAGPELSFMIKELGDFTRTVGRIETGAVAYVDGPYGILSVDGRAEPGVALIAGGVGLAPLIDRVFSEKEFSEWVFVMCGPAIMMDIVEDHLIRRGTPSDRIFSERFSYD
jgi:predicted ferric reductase